MKLIVCFEQHKENIKFHVQQAVPACCIILVFGIFPIDRLLSQFREEKCLEKDRRLL